MTCRLWIGMLVPLVGLAQTFEVASVKLNTTCGGRVGALRPTPGRLSITCYKLSTLVIAAYSTYADSFDPGRIRPKVSGGPAWVGTDFYDITATASGATPMQMAGPMLQRLLEERFQLKVHRDQKEGDAYVLRVAEGGPKLKEWVEGSCLPFDPFHGPEKPTDGETPRCNLTGRRGQGNNMVVESHGMNLGFLTTLLSSIVREDVINGTGLTGLYDFHAEFATDINNMDGVSVFAAMQKLGLKLEPGKGPFETLVIDRVERPTEN
jgi:uncharacterized protein (TIGR03435 family)